MRYIALIFLLFVNTITANEFVDGQNRFGFELFAEVSDPQKNSCQSPYSIASALSLAHAGSANQTKSQMQAMLGYPEKLSFADLHKEISRLHSFLAPVVSSAEALAVDARFEPLASYLETVQKKLGAEVFQVDTGKDVQKALSRINGWVSAKTKGFIPSLLQPGDIDNQTKMVLLNAVYLKAQWASPFMEHDTKDGSFFTPSSGKLTVPLMHKKENMMLYKNDQYYAVWQEMRKETESGPQLETIVILPKNEDARNLKLTSELLASWKKAASQEYVELILPKCSQRTRSELRQPLIALGMVDAFSSDADFSLIHSGNVLQVGNVIHEAFMQIDESGIEAAAATAVMMAVKSALAPTKKPIVVRCDTPFYVVIREKKSGLVLFISYIATPEKIVVRS